MTRLLRRILLLVLLFTPVGEAPGDVRSMDVSADSQIPAASAIPDASAIPAAESPGSEPATAQDELGERQSIEDRQDVDEADADPSRAGEPGLDTLSQAYAEKWEGAEQAAQRGPVWVRVLGGNDLMPVVLTVSLIIWGVLLTYLIRLERRLKRMEQSGSDHTRAG